MTDEPSGDLILTPRGRRALVLIAAAVLVLVGSGLASLGAPWRTSVPGTSSGSRPRVPAGNTITNISFFDSQAGWAVLSRLPSRVPTNIVRTADGGHHWTPADVPLSSSYSLTRFFDSRHAMVTTNTPLGQALYSTNDGGAHWLSLNLPGRRNDRLASFVFLDSRRGWYLAGTPATVEAAPPGGLGQSFLLWRTADGGASWNAVVALDPAHPMAGALSYAGIKSQLSFLDAENGVLVSDPTDTFYLTRDGGLSWESRPLPAVPGWLAGVDGGTFARLIPLRGLLVELLSANFVESARPNLLSYARVSADGGSTWTDLTRVPGTGTGLTTPQFEDARRWLIADAGMLWRSSDSGQTWQAHRTDLRIPLSFSRIQEVRGGQVWAVASDGGGPQRVLHSRDSGSHWEDLGVPAVEQAA